MTATAPGPYEHAGAYRFGVPTEQMAAAIKANAAVVAGATRWTPECVSPEPDNEGGFSTPIGPRSLAADLAYVEDLVADNRLLKATNWDAYTLSGRLWVKVSGSNHAAHAWHVAIGGRPFPWNIDRHGVRRKMIIGPRVSAEIIDDPRKAGGSGA